MFYRKRTRLRPFKTPSICLKRMLWSFSGRNCFALWYLRPSLILNAFPEQPVRNKNLGTPCKLLTPPRSEKGAELFSWPPSLLQHIPGSRGQLVPGSAPPWRLPATLPRARSGWGLAAGGDAAERAGRVMWAGWAARRGGRSRAPRSCNRTPERSPLAPATFHSLPSAWLSDAEHGSGCRAASTLRIPLQRNSEGRKERISSLGRPRNYGLLGKGLETRSQTCSALRTFPRWSLSASVSWIRCFQHYKFSKTQLWICV